MSSAHKYKLLVHSIVEIEFPFTKVLIELQASLPHLYFAILIPDKPVSATLNVILVSFIQVNHPTGLAPKVGAVLSNL